jgi:hypothetical protein
VSVLGDGGGPRFWFGFVRPGSRAENPKNYLKEKTTHLEEEEMRDGAKQTGEGGTWPRRSSGRPNQKVPAPVDLRGSVEVRSVRSREDPKCRNPRNPRNAASATAEDETRVEVAPD